MELRERVIKGLEHEITRTDLEWLDCVEVSLLRDALELIKVQEPVNVRGMVLGIDGWGGYCPTCNSFLLERQNKHFCGNCGQAVKWE